ncbi:MAG TPA: hypothetical protein VKA36_04815 [Solirubrobacterales bacterium]|nr:hypothetical protein [Solirubrobacterales bacterium]
MATAFVRHEVEDWDRWKQGYDRNGQLRAEGGVREAGIYQAHDNPNDVTVYHVFDSVEDAQAFLGNQDLAEAMKEIGVVGEPQMWITTEVERTS